MTKFIIGVVVAAILSSVLTYNFTVNNVTKNSDNELQKYAKKASLGKLIRSATAIGIVQPKVGAEVKVGSQISGIVKEIKVSIGDHVEKGQELALLDDSLLSERAFANGEEVKIREYELKYSEKQLERIKNLMDVTAEFKELKEKEIQVNRALYHQSVAKYEESKTMLSYARITAPIKGTIGSISTYEGETVQASFAAPTFVNIIDLERQEIQAYVDETDIGSIFIGQKVDFRLESYPDKTIAGTVRAINPKPRINGDVVSYVVQVDFEQPEKLLIRPEMTAHVDFILEKKENVIVVSSTSLIRENGENYIIVKKNGVWEKQIVDIGLTEAGKIELTNGLNEGDIYLQDKNIWRKIQEGMKI